MMAVKKTRYKQGVDDGYISCANAVLHFMSSADRQHVQNLAESLGVTHNDMLKVEDKEDLDFEDDIHENSSYWK